MPIIVEKSKAEIKFIIHGKIYQQIFDWSYSLDKTVFEKQLATGKFKGERSLSAIQLDIMKKAKNAGKILPYYGASGGGGCDLYRIQLQHESCKITVEHTYLEQSAVFSTNEIVSKKGEPRYKWMFWLWAKPIDPEVEEPHIALRFDGNVYDNLKDWEFWNDNEALTDRYVYQFGRVTLGRLGYAIKVEDTRQGATIDISDYDDW